MEYSYSAIAEIKAKVFQFVAHELDVAVKNSCVEEFLAKYSIVLEDTCPPLEKRRAKILVFGSLACDQRICKAIANNYGIEFDKIEFISDYDKLKNVDVSKYRYSSIYSDIIYGPTPHKQVGMGDTSSFLAEMKNHPDEYPRVIEAAANKELKITKHSFEDALKKSRYYQKLVLEG